MCLSELKPKSSRKAASGARPGHKQNAKEAMQDQAMSSNKPISMCLQMYVFEIEAKTKLNTSNMAMSKPFKSNSKLGALE